MPVYVLASMENRSKTLQNQRLPILSLKRPAGGPCGVSGGRMNKRSWLFEPCTVLLANGHARLNNIPGIIDGQCIGCDEWKCLANGAEKGFCSALQIITPACTQEAHTGNFFGDGHRPFMTTSFGQWISGDSLQSIRKQVPYHIFILRIFNGFEWGCKAENNQYEFWGNLHKCT